MDAAVLVVRCRSKWQSDCLTLDMAIDKHPDLADRTFTFACAIVKFCLKLSAQPGVTRQIAWQLADAGTSIAANYEEAKAAYSRREFKAKTSIVLKEARESRLWLRGSSPRIISPAPRTSIRCSRNRTNSSRCS